MGKVKVVLHPMFDGFGDVVTKEREIDCYSWSCNENYYIFFLTQDERKVLSIPKENVMYVEDIV